MTTTTSLMRTNTSSPGAKTNRAPEQAKVSVETTTAAPAVAGTVAAAAIATNDRSTVATVHHAKWLRASSTEPPINGNHTPRL